MIMQIAKEGRWVAEFRYFTLNTHTHLSTQCSINTGGRGAGVLKRLHFQFWMRLLENIINITQPVGMSINDCSFHFCAVFFCIWYFNSFVYSDLINLKRLLTWIGVFLTGHMPAKSTHTFVDCIKWYLAFVVAFIFS